MSAITDFMLEMCKPRPQTFFINRKFFRAAESLLFHYKFHNVGSLNEEMTPWLTLSCLRTHSASTAEQLKSRKRIKILLDHCFVLGVRFPKTRIVGGTLKVTLEGTCTYWLECKVKYNCIHKIYIYIYIRTYKGVDNFSYIKKGYIILDRILFDSLSDINNVRNTNFGVSCPCERTKL